MAEFKEIKIYIYLDIEIEDPLSVNVVFKVSLADCCCTAIAADTHCS